MSNPDSGNKKSIVVLGATGMIGGLVLRYALEEPSVGSVLAIGRRPTGLDSAKLQEVQHGDFLDFSPVSDVLESQDAAFFCLGAYTGSVPDEKFQEITVDYSSAFFRALYERSPEASVCFLSGQGADQKEKSRISFARYKGMAENALLAMGFPRVFIFRPGYIYPVQSRPEPNFSYRVFRRVYPVVRPFYPNIGINSQDLANAMVHAGLNGTPGYGSPVLENRDIRGLAEREGPPGLPS